MEGMEGRRRLLTGLAGAGQSSPRAAPPLSRRSQEAPRGLSEEAQGAQEPYTPMGNQANQPKSQIDLKGSSHISIYIYILVSISSLLSNSISKSM